MFTATLVASLLANSQPGAPVIINPRLCQGGECKPIESGKVESLAITPDGQIFSPELEQRARKWKPVSDACNNGDAQACLRIGEHRKSFSLEAALSAFMMACAYREQAGCNRADALLPSEDVATKVRIDTDTDLLHAVLADLCRAGSSRRCFDQDSIVQEDGRVFIDRSAGLRRMLDACEANHAMSCYNAYVALHDGVFVKKAPRKALNLALRGCDLGSAGACEGAANVLTIGDGVEANAVAAAKMWRKACDLGLARGCNNYGTVLYKGDGLKVDYPESIKYLSMACDMGYAQACHGAGWVGSFAGDAALLSDKEVKSFYVRACEGGFTHACKFFGMNDDVASRAGAKRDETPTTRAQQM